MPDAGRAGEELLVWRPGGGDAGEIAFDVGGEHGDAEGRDLFGQHLQRLGLAGTGRAGHQAVPVQHRQRDAHLCLRDGLAVDERADLQRGTVKGVAGLDQLDDLGTLGFRRWLGLRLLRRGGEFLGSPACFHSRLLGSFGGFGGLLGGVVRGVGLGVAGRHGLRITTARRTAVES